MAASFPSTVKNFTVKVDGVDDVQADHINDLQLEVAAVETELGPDPAGNHATVVERLDTVDTGWVKDATAWVRTSETTFTRAGATANLFPKGAKLRWKENGGAYRYAYAVGLSGETITTAGDTLTNGTTISDMAVSYAATPQGFPQRFSYTPAWTNLTTTGSPITTGSFYIVGQTLFFQIKINPNGGTTASAGGTYASLPIVPTGDGTLLAAAVAYPAISGVGSVWSSGGGRAYTPAWTASTRYFVIDGCAPIM
jgi:hypothetical protein